MAKYIITGGNKLHGRIRISGNKNAILPCMAAALLTEEEVTLRNVPRISDVDILSRLLEWVGARVERGEDWIKITSPKIRRTDLPQDLVSKLRASILLVGALIGRIGKVEFTHPGGDVIGRRDIDRHLNGFTQLGCKVQTHDRKYKVKQTSDGKDEVRIFVDMVTVTGTENLIMASARREGKTVIRNAAAEPHVVNLCQMLVKMGVEIEGIGTSTLAVKGKKVLKGAEFTIDSDYIEFGTYAIAAAVTGGEIEIENCSGLDLDPIIWPMVRMGLSIKANKQVIKISSRNLVAIRQLITNVWPGFPTDLMSVVIVLATQSRGISLLHDWVHDSRMFFVDKLITMGANITIADPYRVVVYGSTRLYGRNLETPDIRAGMALVLAALTARGQSTINRAELIERGYDDVISKLTSLGADIQRLE